MTSELVGLLGLAIMFILMALRIPVSMSLAVPALLGIIYLQGIKPMFAAVESIVWTNSFNYTFSTIPMFILMGELLFISGITQELFATFRAWFGRIRGGLAMATVGASAGFSAASGSSLATTGTMGVVTSKEMLSSGYNRPLAAGSIVAGGTLGILIPPSTLLIIYGMLTQASIGQLLIAGIIPGIVLTILFILTITVIVLIKPSLAPVGESTTWKEKFYSLKNIFWVLVIFSLVIGGIYSGWFSPTEAAGIGAMGAFLIALIRRKMTVEKLKDALASTLKTTGFLFAIALAAFVLNYFLVITGVPKLLVGSITESGLSIGAIFFLIILMYLIIGAFMDTLSIIIITIPLLLPVLQALEIDIIWFGIIVVLCVEMALITPPLGGNCFVLKSVAPEFRIEDIFKGALVFVIPILVLITLLYFFPQIAMYLPSKMY